MDDGGAWTEEHLLALTLIRAEVVSCAEQLSEALQIDPYTARILLDNLEQAGFVRRITIGSLPSVVFRPI